VRSWKRLRFPKVTVQFGEPITFEAVEQPTREQQQEASERIFDDVRRMYVGLEEKGRRGVIKALKEGIEGLDPAPEAKLTVRS
jgi:1-acyl-sn-glycerol-3-phosphate acyltransferase